MKTYIIECNIQKNEFSRSLTYGAEYLYRDALRIVTDANCNETNQKLNLVYRMHEVKALVPDTQVRQYLPFLTSVSEGATYFHIRNESAYPVETKAHIIEPGDTLCARGGNNSQTLRFAHPTCPGCLAKANNIVVTHLMHYMDLTGGPRE